MKKENCMIRFLKKHFKANPISYLGWLGILGMLGVCFVPLFSPFLLCFSFFAYSHMQADELFWQNVHKASSRGFWSVFLLDVGVFSWMFVRGMTIGRTAKNVPYSFSDGVATLSTFMLDQYCIAFFALCANLIIMILVFTISMMKFRRQEKKTVEEE